MKCKIGVLLLAVTLFAGCAKELSFEGPDTPAQGSLQSDITGDCLPKTVNGTYVAGTALVPATNTITVSVSVVEAGTYHITTDTVNGYFFSGSGQFTSTGINQVTLQSNGTPFASGVNNFAVSFDSTFCDIQVSVLPSGAGGPAVYTLEGTGSPASCSGATASGNYIIGTALNGSNAVTLSVNVTTIGTYNIATTATNGMTFTGSGAFLSTGVQPVVLTGSGTPSGTAGTVTIPVTAGSSTCSFQVTTVTGSTYSFDCASAVVNGTYQAGTPLTSSNTVSITVNVATAGPYNIITTATNGMTFSASGTFSTTGPVTIDLTGSGTPTTAGTFNITVPGTTPCSFAVTCIAGATVNWKFTAGSTTYQGESITGILSVQSGVNLIVYQGGNALPDQFAMGLIDISGGINNGESYNTSNAPTSNTGTFLFIASTGQDWQANSGIAGTSIVFKVTSHVPSTKTITGTFSGTVKDSGGTSVSITGGTFNFVYE